MTEALYLEDSYLKEMETTIVEVSKENENRWQIVLDKTIFYPRGGRKNFNPALRKKRRNDFHPLPYQLKQA